MAVAVFLFFQLGFSAALIVGGTAVFVLIPAVFLTPLRREPDVLAGVLALILAACCFCHYDQAVVKPLYAADNATLSLTVRVEEDHTGYTTFKVLQGDLPKGTVLGSYSSGAATTEWRLWDVVKGDFLLEISSHPTHRSHNVLLSAFPQETATVIGEDTPWYGLFYDIRHYARSVLTKRLEKSVASLPAAICFGDTTLLSGTIKQRFRDAGLSHLLVTSGLHVSVITQAVWALLRRLRCSRRLSALLSFAPLILFMGICGFGYSILRAGLMQAILLLSQTGKRESDSRNSLGGALLLIVFFQPYAALDAGLWLSFGSTAGILLFAPALQRECRKIKWKPFQRTAQSVCITLSALLPILPITAILFGELSLISPLSNLLTVLAAQPMLVATYAGVLISLVPPLGFLVDGLIFVTGLLSRYLLLVTEWLSSLPFATVSLDKSYLLFWLTGSVLLLVLFGKLRQKRGVIEGLSLSAISLCLGVLVYTGSMYGVTTVSAPTLSNSSAVLFQSGSRTALIFSCESLSDISETKRFLLKNGITSLDVLILQDENQQFDSQKELFFEDISVSVLATESEAPLPCETRFSWEEGAKLTAWESFGVERGLNNWIRVSIGEASVILCPYQGNTAVLPQEWLACDLLLMDRSVPTHITAISAAEGCLRCDPSDVSHLTKGLPWGSYPITLQTETECFYMLRESGTIFKVD